MGSIVAAAVSVPICVLAPLVVGVVAPPHGNLGMTLLASALIDNRSAACYSIEQKFQSA